MVAHKHQHERAKRSRQPGIFQLWTTGLKHSTEQLSNSEHQSFFPLELQFHNMAALRVKIKNKKKAQIKVSEPAFDFTFQI